MMKVLNVNHLLDPVSGGGTAERTFQMSRFLASAGVDTTILTLDEGLDRQRLRTVGNVKVVALPLLLRRFFLPRCRFAEIRKLVAAADIVHLMGHWTVLNALVYRAIRQERKPYVVCPAGALPIYGRSKLLKRAYNLLVGQSIISRANLHIAITGNEIPQFEQYGVGAARVAVVPNGIASADFTAQDDQGFRNRFGLGGKPFILFMGRLNHIKGPDLLLEAFVAASERLPQHNLVFAGPDGGMLSALRETACSSRLADRVHFIGYLDAVEKVHAYHAADFLVIPSRQEAMSIVVLEAGACATPVLMTDQCGFGCLDEIDGGLVVEASVAGIAAGLSKLAACEATELETMGNNLRRYVLDHYEWGAIISRYLKIYRQLLAAANNQDGK